MKSLYLRLAAGGISKNRRTYFPYILTCAGMIMINYILSFLQLSSFVAEMNGGNTIQLILTLGSTVIIIFSIIFLFYTNSFLIRRRKTEFGLYNILGMGKKNIARILMWETVIIYAVSELLGLGCGILFSKLAELLVAKMLSGDAVYRFTANIRSVMDSLIPFGIIFLFISIKNLAQLHLTDPIELMHSENIGEKPPKANWLFAAAGAVILGIAYYIAVTVPDPVSAILIFFVAVIMVIIATYLLFMSGSVALCKILQKNKSYYYKTNHFISVSQMIYRMKRNGAGLASICILSTMTLVTLSSTICLYLGEEDLLRMRYPRDIAADTLTSYTSDKEYQTLVNNTVDDVLKEYGEAPENAVKYRFLPETGGFSGDTAILDPDKINEFTNTLYPDIRQIYFITVDDYNRLTGKSESLQKNEVLVYSNKRDYTSDTLTISEYGTFKVKGIAESALRIGMDAAMTYPSLYVYVKDEAVLSELFEMQLKIYGEHPSYIHNYYGFDLSCGDEKQSEIGAEIFDRLKALSSEDEMLKFSTDCAANERADFYALYGGLFFLGVLLGGVFICAAVLIMYYKQISEGFEDKARFDILQKLGLTKKEIRKSINSQVLTVFFLPLAAAGIHTAFAFPLIAKMLTIFGMNNTSYFAIVTLCCIGAFAAIYTAAYMLTSKGYYRIVS